MVAALGRVARLEGWARVVASLRLEELRRQLQESPAAEWTSTVVTGLARLLRQRGRSLREEELTALVWTLEFSKPRPDIDEFRSMLSEAAISFLGGGKDADDLEPVAVVADDQAEEVLAGLEAVLFASMDLAAALDLGEPWSCEPQDCFDADLFYQLRGVLGAGGSLRSLLGRQGGGSLTGARAARLARMLSSRLPLAGDSSGARRGKFQQAKARGEEILLEGIRAEQEQEARARPSQKRQAAADEGRQTKATARQPRRPIVDLDSEEDDDAAGVAAAMPRRRPRAELGSDAKGAGASSRARPSRPIVDLDSEEDDDAAVGGADAADVAAPPRPRAAESGSEGGQAAASSSGAHPRRELIDLDSEGDDDDQPLDSESEEEELAMLGRPEEASGAKDSGASLDLKRAVLFMHHIAAPAKKRFIRQKAKRFGLTGLFLFGQPGRVLVEGEATAVDRYVQEVKSLRWMICSLQGSWPTEGRSFDRFRQVRSDREFREELGRAELAAELEGLHASRPAAKRHGMEQHAQP